MKRRVRLGWLASLLAVAASTLCIVCGGKIASGPPGQLDDAGVFHEPDGATLFGPGSACKHYDAAAYIQATTNPPTCPEGDGMASPTCEKWVAEAGLSFGYVPFAGCRLGRCSVDELPLPIDDSEPAVGCVWGPEGDAYCRSFYQQFLLHGTAGGYCKLRDLTNAHGQNGVCRMNDCGVGGGVLAVAADGGITYADGGGGGDIPFVPVSAPGDYTVCEPPCLP